MNENLPPVIPPPQPPVIQPPPPPVIAPSLQTIPGAEGMTPADLQDAAAQGGRFVMFQYCFSVLILTFKRSSPIMFLKAGESAFAKGAPYSLISLLAGWWGIPWGPIWTLTTLATNISGGKDVTREVLSAFGLAVPAAPPPMVSPAEAAERESRKSFILRLGWAAAILLFLGLAWVGYKIFEAGKELPP